jgi:hypothetical protein
MTDKFPVMFVYRIAITGDLACYVEKWLKYIEFSADVVMGWRSGANN